MEENKSASHANKMTEDFAKRGDANGHVKVGTSSFSRMQDDMDPVILNILRLKHG